MFKLTIVYKFQVFKSQFIAKITFRSNENILPGFESQNLGTRISKYNFSIPSLIKLEKVQDF